ncbi:hypothetical protein [Paenibacillus agricola]|uniref:Uncharacterized protein n=1 Tax=Paenibacillus agricola TaxID=2716264 RepID=A0ABX0J8Q7_9BACL|nr:hypothetical protein [Paenibacillus agricola]NHN32537.1 hypothetical protein [Paenibacillus agricola]
MYKRLIIGLLLVLLWVGATNVYAHLTGAFAEYLASVHDESTTNKLKQEVDSIEAEIGELIPRMNTKEKEYKLKQTVAVDKLLFYNEQGLDMWASMLQQSSDVVDLLGNQWLMERNLNAYLHELEQLHTDYSQLVLTKDTLSRYRELLDTIGRNLALRQPYLDSVKDYSLEEKSNFLDIDWDSEVEDKLVAALDKDKQLVIGGWREWVAPRSRMSVPNDAAYEMNEEWLNERSSLHYYFRSDHIYTVFEQPGANVILIGQVLNNDQNHAELQFESGFYNGFLMPAVLLEELKGFRLPYEELKMLQGATKASYLQQSSGKLLLLSTP